MTCVPGPDAAVCRGDGVCECVLRRLLPTDPDVPVRRPVASAALPLQLRLHPGGERGGEERRHQPTGTSLCHYGSCSVTWSVVCH